MAKIREHGEVGLSRAYWQEHYASPEEMDAIGNAKEHAEYIHALFTLEQIGLSSVIDYGCGPGLFLKQLLKRLAIEHAVAIEPSPYAFTQLKKNLGKKKGVRLVNQGLVKWCQETLAEETVYQLGLCTSVLQYLSEKELAICIPAMALQVQYLYLTVPTDVEYQLLKRDLNFVDDYAYVRPRSFYLKYLKKDFTFVSNRVLESKCYFNAQNSEFREMLYRY